MGSSRRDSTASRVYQLARDLGVESREVLRCARILGLDITSPLAGVANDDADQIRARLKRTVPTTIRTYELARELGVEARDVLECARVVGLDITSPLAGITNDDADQIRTCILRPHPSTIRAYELARELGVESRDVLECARVLGLDITSPLAGITTSDADLIRSQLQRFLPAEIWAEESVAERESDAPPEHDLEPLDADGVDRSTDLEAVRSVDSHRAPLLVIGDVDAGHKTEIAATPDVPEESPPVTSFASAPIDLEGGTPEEVASAPHETPIDGGTSPDRGTVTTPTAPPTPHVSQDARFPDTRPSPEPGTGSDRDTTRIRRPFWTGRAIAPRAKVSRLSQQWRSAVGPREITWLLVAWAALLPLQFPLFGAQKRGLQLAPSDLVLALIVLIALPHIRFRERTWSAWHFAFPIAIAASALFFGVLSRYAVFNKLAGMLVLLALYAVLTSFAVTWRRIWLIMRAFVISVVLANTVVSVALIIRVDLPMRICHSPSCIRLTGFYSDANIYGSLLIVALAFLLATMGTPARLIPRGMPTILSLVSLVVGLFLTLSRSSWIGMALVIVALVLLRPRQAARSVIVGGAVLATLFMFVFGPRTADLLSTAGRTFSIESRFRIIDNAIAAFRENPIIGIGIGTFPDRYDAIVHNTALWLAAELGLVGLVLFFGFFFWIGWRLLWLYRNTTGSHQAIVLGLGLAHFAMLGFSIGVEAFYQRHWWLAMALIAAAYATEWETIHSLEGTVDDSMPGGSPPDRRVPEYR
jgi:O-antigen ligase